MMLKSFKTAAVLIAGMAIGIMIYVQFFSLNGMGNDSLLLDYAYADVQSDLYSSRKNSITEAVERVSPAVVSVNVVQVREYIRPSPFSSRDPFLREFFPELFRDRRYQQRVQSLGSGFIVSKDGHIVTNDHVIESAAEVVITMAGGKKADAEIIGTDPISDIALLKVNMDEVSHVTLGNSDDIILGEWAIAIGNPFGLFEINNRSTVTVGVVSATDRDFGEMQGRIYQDMIQTDASINTGNSGGPLVNALGEVIGMNTFIYTGSQRTEGSVGIGFAIPINRIARLLADLKTYGKIDRNFWIGIKVQNLNRLIARKLGYEGTEGVLIGYIDRYSPAEKAGLRLEDIITHVEGRRIINDEDLREIVYESDLRVGDTLEFTVWRKDEIKTITLTLESIEQN